MHGGPAGDHRYIVTAAQGARLADDEGVVGAAEGGLDPSARAQINGAVVRDGRPQCTAQLGAVAGRQHHHLRNGPHEGDVGHAVVGGAPLPEGDAGQGAHDLHVAPPVGQVRPYELGGAEGGEGGVGAHHGDQVHGGHPRGHGHQILFGDPHVDEAFGEGPFEALELGAIAQVCGERHQARIIRREGHQDLTPGLGLVDEIHVLDGPGEALDLGRLLRHRAQSPTPSSRAARAAAKSSESRAP